MKGEFNFSVYLQYMNIKIIILRIRTYTHVALYTKTHRQQKKEAYADWNHSLNLLPYKINQENEFYI